MRAAFVCVVLAAVTAWAGSALAQNAPAPGQNAPTPGQPPVEPQMTGSPASQPPTSQPTAAPRPATPPRPAQIRGVPPGVVNPRRPRTFVQCNQEALRRGMRGAERRHWIQRCELGYGRPLFRRRGPTVTQPPAGADTAPATQDRGGEAGSP